MEEVTVSSESCALKAQREGQPHFTVIGQDVTADLAVEWWADANRFMQQCLRRGYTVKDALAELRLRMVPLKRELEPQSTPKIDQAYAIAKRMREYPDRKVAD